MRASRGEIKIEEILQASGLNFEEEYIFPDLISTSGRPLRFDFAVFDDDGDLDFLIEYQGIQHYEAKSKFGGYTGLRKQQYNDMLKNKGDDYIGNQYMKQYNQQTKFHLKYQSIVDYIY